VRHDRAVGNINVPSGQYYASLARARQGAGALVTTNDGRVVMIDTTYSDFYEVPGGAVELGENAPLACARECREELGMEISIGRLLALDHQCDGGQWGDSVMYVYDGGSVEPEMLVSQGTDAEVAAIVLVEPADLDSVTIPRLANRVRGALAARSQGTVFEAINGTARG
jgi:8-oxo-dGTP diphosphatase